MPTDTISDAQASFAKAMIETTLWFGESKSFALTKTTERPAVFRPPPPSDPSDSKYEDVVVVANQVVHDGLPLRARGNGVWTSSARLARFVQFADEQLDRFLNQVDSSQAQQWPICVANESERHDRLNCSVDVNDNVVLKKLKKKKDGTVWESSCHFSLEDWKKFVQFVAENFSQSGSRTRKLVTRKFANEKKKSPATGQQTPVFDEDYVERLKYLLADNSNS